jgi:hypothetical protein
MPPYLKTKKTLISISFLLTTITILGIYFFHSPNDPNIVVVKSVLRSERDFVRSGDNEVNGVPDNEFTSHFSGLDSAFADVNFSVRSDLPLAKKKVDKIAEYNSQEKKVESSFGLKGINIRTEYLDNDNGGRNQTMDGKASKRIKQTIYVENTEGKDKIIDFSIKNQINTDTITYEGKEYKIGKEKQSFKAYEKTASIPEFAKDTGSKDLEGVNNFSNYVHTYQVGANITFQTEDNQTASYDWADAGYLNHEVIAYATDEGYFLELLIKDFPVPANETAVIDPAYALSDSRAYEVRYDGPEPGPAENPYIGESIVIGDINGDGIDDLVLGSSYADNNGADSGSAFVIFGSADNATGTKPFNIQENYNLRFDGSAAFDYLTAGGALAIGDLNGDGQNDLVLGDYLADHNGSNSGSAYLILSELIQAYGTSTGNQLPLSTAGSYNLRWAGSAADDYLTSGGALAIGDLNGDGQNDLVLGAPSADHNGSNSGSAYLILSELIQAYGTSTGNQLPLSTAGSYNLRWAGSAADDYLTIGGAIVIGDLNGDGDSDLVLGAPYADHNGSNSGSAYLILSELIQAYGTSTGNNLPLSTAGSYNLRWAGSAAGDLLTRDGTLAIGDLNGDGQNDLVLGAPYADHNGSNSGSAYLILSELIQAYGTSTGNNLPLSTAGSYNLRWAGSAASDNLTAGAALAIGDLNGDGQNDLVLGAPYADHNGSNSGSAYLILSELIQAYGTSTGNNLPLSTAGSYNLRWAGSAASDNLTAGAALAIGDLNGDGQNDLVLGAPYASHNGSYSGSAYLILSELIQAYGTSTGNQLTLSTAGSYNLRWAGSAAFDRLTALAIGDLNGDGQNDLVLGALYAGHNGSNSGSAYLILSELIQTYGTSTDNNLPLSETSSFDIRYDGNLNEYAQLGWTGAVAIGDLNNDGLDDLVVGAPYNFANGYNSGSAFVVFGSENRATGTRPFNVAANYNLRFDGSASYDYLTLGGALAIGDLNGDGQNDLVLGAYGADHNGSDSGSAYLILSELIQAYGTSTGNQLPLSTAGSYNLRWAGSAADDYLTSGGALAIGDLNGDGQNDLVLGAPSADHNGSNSGSAYLILSELIQTYGTSTGNQLPLSTAGSYNLRWAGSAASDNLTDVGALAIGDLNGDGQNDLVLGAPYADHNGSNSGSAYLILSELIQTYGTSTGNNLPLSTAGSYNLRWAGSAASDNLTRGGALAIGDLNGDGQNDLVLGAPSADHNGSNSGSAYLILSELIQAYGTSTGNQLPLSTAGSYNLRWAGSAADDYLTIGGALAIGDLNGDGQNDLVLGAPSADYNGSDSGSAYLILSELIQAYGTSTGNNLPLSTAGSYNLRWDGSAASDYLTADGALAIGDLNGDGQNDLVLGAYGTDYNGSDSGSVYVIYSTLMDDVGNTTGNNKSLSTAANYSIRYDGTAASDQLTYENIFTTGDATGDGKNNLLMSIYANDYNGTDSGSLYIIDFSATSLYFSVGQDSTTDRKTGAPTLTLSSGTATFSTGQTGNIGVGDVITYNTDQTCYVSGKTSQTVWSCHTASGTVPADIADSEVVSIKRAFTSISAAESGAEALLGTSDLVLNKFQLNFPCYYDTGADTTAVTVDGWSTSGHNNIKIYAPDDTVGEVNFSQRHKGVWDDTKFTYNAGGNTTAFTITQEYTVVEGLQIECFRSAGSTYNTAGINLVHRATANLDGAASCTVKNNIIRNSGVTKHTGIRDYTTVDNLIANNILIGHGNAILSRGLNAKAYNNTIYNNSLSGIKTEAGTLSAVNNIIIASTDSHWQSAGTLSVSYTASNDGDGANAITLSTADYDNIFENYLAGDFRLKSYTGNNSVIDRGQDLSSLRLEAYDIKNTSRERSSAWDLGAHEAPAPIYRSVGQGANLNTESRTVEIVSASSTAVFSGAMPADIGIGDVLQYQIGSSYNLAFIHSRSSDTAYTVKQKDATFPTSAPAGTAVAVYRAYESLYDAERGEENANIAASVRDFDDWTDGNDLDHTNEQWNIACYADASPDTQAVSITDWTTGTSTYLKIFTPTQSTEAGQSQRHTGSWSDTAYYLSHNTAASTTLDVNTNSIRLEGLQIEADSTGAENNAIVLNSGQGQRYLSHSIIKATANTATETGISMGVFAGPGYVYNNIIYGFKGDASSAAVYQNNTAGGHNYFYHNTITDSHQGIVVAAGAATAQNNAVFNTVDDFSGSFTVISYNASDDGDGTSAVILGDQSAWVKALPGYAENDFRIQHIVSKLYNAGTVVSFVSDDIIGTGRPKDNSYDIGAFEYGSIMPKYRFDPAGTYRFQGSVRFE